MFIDGDARVAVLRWHARVLREKGPEALQDQMKTANRGYWIDKFSKRVDRDDEVTAALEEDGWTVVRIWETDARADLEGVADLIEAVLGRRCQH